MIVEALERDANVIAKKGRGEVAPHSRGEKYLKILFCP